MLSSMNPSKAFIAVIIELIWICIAVALYIPFGLIYVVYSKNNHGGFGNANLYYFALPIFLMSGNRPGTTSKSTAPASSAPAPPAPAPAQAPAQEQTFGRKKGRKASFKKKARKMKSFKIKSFKRKY